MLKLKMTLRTEEQKFSAPFKIAGFVFEAQAALVVQLEDVACRGSGEAAGVYYLGDTVERMSAQLEAVRASIEAGTDRAAIQSLLPVGGARNALDCALWELDAQRSQMPVWKLAGMAPPRPLLTTFTLGAEDAHVMAGRALKLAARAIKMKLTGDLQLDRARVRAVRDARPDVWLGVDANQAYSIDALDDLIDALLPLDVRLLEQPLRRGCESDLDGFGARIPLAADESVLGIADLAQVAGRFDVVNIKLDKCGGLTEALRMAAKVRDLGMRVMVGNMVGSSLAMAPAFIVGQLCDIVDLDGPTFLVQDRVPGIRYEDGYVWSGSDVWGGGRSCG